MDFGKLYLKDKRSGKREECLQHFIEAYLIYDSYFTENALQTAEAAMNIAKLMQESKRIREAYKYAQVAAKTYQNCYSFENPTIILALW